MRIADVFLFSLILVFKCLQVCPTYTHCCNLFKVFCKQCSSIFFSSLFFSMMIIKLIFLETLCVLVEFDSYLIQFNLYKTKYYYFYIVLHIDVFFEKLPFDFVQSLKQKSSNIFTMQFI